MTIWSWWKTVRSHVRVAERTHQIYPGLFCFVSRCCFSASIEGVRQSKCNKFQAIITYKTHENWPLWRFESMNVILWRKHCSFTAELIEMCDEITHLLKRSIRNYRCPLRRHDREGVLSMNLFEMLAQSHNETYGIGLAYLGKICTIQCYILLHSGPFAGMISFSTTFPPSLTISFILILFVDLLFLAAIIGCRRFSEIPWFSLDDRGRKRHHVEVVAPVEACPCDFVRLLSGASPLASPTLKVCRLITHWPFIVIDVKWRHCPVVATRRTRWRFQAPWLWWARSVSHLDGLRRPSWLWAVGQDDWRMVQLIRPPLPCPG